MDEILQAWKGDPHGDFRGVPLLLDRSNLGMLTTLWGDPHTGSVKVIASGELVQTAWDQRPSWAIIPFEALNPRWKVLEVDGISPIHKDFDPEKYALSIPISLVGDAPIKPEIPTGNRNPDKLTTLVMTGVTALVRATAFTMERQGVTYPARDIGHWLRDADITHISNEVPFAEDCPYPNPVQEGMRFCSDDRYIELLEHVGTDVVELTGDHFSDWGAPATLHTLELYDQRSWPYYGGGANLEEGRQAAILTHNGNRLAFIGCNAKGGGYAGANSSNPGAVACDFNWMAPEVQRLRGEGYLPIATFQHFEYYTYAAQANQVRDAQKLTEAGAIIVSGSQAHHPQAIEFSNGGFVHHGLGNLFFDQLDVSVGARQGFIDRHVFYDGRHISTELLTIWFEDYARARPMTAEERDALLTVVFQASGW
jgi:poly-gamma-glutamate synthesis protein (capsule biosynthesis protein)